MTIARNLFVALFSLSTLLVAGLGLASVADEGLSQTSEQPVVARIGIEGEDDIPLPVA